MLNSRNLLRPTKPPARYQLTAFVPSKNTPQLSAVVFDMDGVIVDSHPAHCRAWKEFLLLFGKNVSDNELNFVLDGRKRNEILSHFLGPLTEEQLKAYGKLKDEFFWRTTSEIVPIPGVLEFIENIRKAGIALAMATSASAKRTCSTLERLGLLPYFAAIVTGDDVRDGKPHPEIYQLACKRANFSPSDVVAIEDAPSGVRAAKSAGLKCLGIASAQSDRALTAAGADYVLADFVSLSLARFQSILGMQVQRPSTS